MLLDDAVQFLNHIKLFDTCCELADEIIRQGIGHTQLQDMGFIPEDFLHILIGGRGGDDADVSRSLLDAVDRGGFRIFPESLRAFFHYRMPPFGVAGHHHIFADVFLIRLIMFLALAGFHYRLGMCHPGAHLEEHRGIVFLGKLVGEFCESQRFGGIRRLQHGQLCSSGVVAAVLFVLGGMAASIISHYHHKAGIDPRVGHGEQGIGGYIQPHMLLGAEGPASCQRCTEGGLHCHLFIGCPFAVNLIIKGSFLGDLGTGSTGITGDKAHSGLIQAPGYGLIAQHQFFHKFALLN